MTDEERANGIYDEAMGPEYRSSVSSKPAMEKKQFRPKFKKGDKVYVLVARGGLEGPYTVETIFGDVESGKFWYNLRSGDGLTPLKDILEEDLQKKPT